jgi:hypothetical protein
VLTDAERVPGAESSDLSDTDAARRIGIDTVRGLISD